MDKNEEQMKPGKFGESCKLFKDEIHLLQIFPQEIWLLILEKILAHDDLVNTSNSSLFFRRLLLLERVLFLFPGVWQVLGMKYEKDEDPVYKNQFVNNTDFVLDTDDEESEDEIQDAMSLIQDDISQRSNTPELNFRIPRILKLRLVCRTWSDAIDNFYQNLPNHYKMKHDPTFREILNAKNHLPVFHRSDDNDEVGEWAELETFCTLESEYLTQFNEHFDQTHGANSQRCPFLTRKIEVEYSYEEDEFLSDFIAFLVKYGHHVWYCKLTTEDDFPSKPAYYSKLKQILQLLPNLKVLEIDYFKEENEFRDFNYTVRNISPSSFTSEEVAQLEAEIGINPLEKLERLEFLKTKNLPTSVFNELIRSNGHLSMLEVNRVHGQDDYDIYGTASSTLPNLKQLSMECISREDFQKLESSQFASWSLNKLYLDFDSCPFIKWSRLFTVLQNKFENSLTNVMINLPMTKVESEEKQILTECSSLRLHLPQVKRLKLMMTNYSSLDFILPMKNSLENLDITIRCDFRTLAKRYQSLADTVAQQETIRFIDYFGLISRRGREMESTIWTLFPKLERIKLHSRYNSYTGRDWHFVEGRGLGEFFRGGTRKQWLQRMNNEAIS